MQIANLLFIEWKGRSFLVLFFGPCGVSCSVGSVCMQFQFGFVWWGRSDCLCLCIFHICVQIRTLYGRLIILHMFGIGVLGGVGIPHVCVWLGLDSFCLVGLRCWELGPAIAQYNWCSMVILKSRCDRWVRLLAIFSSRLHISLVRLLITLSSFSMSD